MRSRKVGLILAIVGGVAALAIMGTAMAQTPTPTPGQGKQAYAQYFLDRVAAALGVDRAKLDSSMKQAGNDTIDKLVQDGKLGKDQGEKLKQQDKPFLFFGRGFGGKIAGPRPGASKPAAMVVFGGPETRDAIAKALGLSPEQVLTEIKGGKNLKQLAQEKGKEQDVKNAILGEAKKKLDQAVANGGMTRDRADQIYDRLQKEDLLAVYGRIWGHAAPLRSGPVPFRQKSF